MLFFTNCKIKSRFVNKYKSQSSPKNSLLSSFHNNILILLEESRNKLHWEFDPQIPLVQGLKNVLLCEFMMLYSLDNLMFNFQTCYTHQLCTWFTNYDQGISENRIHTLLQMCHQAVKNERFIGPEKKRISTSVRRNMSF